MVSWPRRFFCAPVRRSGRTGRCDATSTITRETCAGWELLVSFEPVRAAARCGFHGGPLLDAAGELIDLVSEDGLQPVERWLLNYAWFARQVHLDEIRDALDAEHMLAVAPLAVPRDARAFAWYLLDAGGQRYVGRSVGVIEARQRLQRISEVAFRRYLARV